MPPDWLYVRVNKQIVTFLSDHTRDSNYGLVMLGLEMYTEFFHPAAQKSQTIYAER